MSSLKATQSDGYYIPPDYINSGAYKNKSLNQYQNSKGHNQYLQNNIVRFELPYDGFCLNEQCRCHVAKGTRFNAQKEHFGDYYSSKLWEFRMKCRQCSNAFIIRTNVANRCFDYIDGIKKKQEEFDTVQAQSLGVIDTDYGHAIHNFTNGRLDVSSEQGGSMCNSSSILDKLEKEVIGQRKTMSDLDAMKILMTHNHCTAHDDARSNSNLRNIYRSARKKKKQKLDEAKSLGLGKGIILDDLKMTDVYESTAAYENKYIMDKNARKLEKVKFRNINKRVFSLNDDGALNHPTMTAVTLGNKHNGYKVSSRLKISPVTKPLAAAAAAADAMEKSMNQKMPEIQESSNDPSSLLSLLDYGSDDSSDC
eukprot:CAMPEP_0176489604 /NCGR_PEP_ID=MMETSP0200_2-20121128/7386_1 /TAXON_ID=947934 /ORGANISM="Chaetoceros sp., Strain GSL56" /LENGTH=365 /DNA_ID=CAMNT_0017886775 /DNA_START=77 /DNA_END=1174 /DNA_ORIENTATION=-